MDQAFCARMFTSCARTDFIEIEIIYTTLSMTDLLAMQSSFP